MCAGEEIKSVSMWSTGVEGENSGGQQLHIDFLLEQQQESLCLTSSICSGCLLLYDPRCLCCFNNLRQCFIKTALIEFYAFVYKALSNLCFSPPGLWVRTAACEGWSELSWPVFGAAMLLCLDVTEETFVYRICSQPLSAPTVESRESPMNF